MKTRLFLAALMWGCVSMACASAHENAVTLQRANQIMKGVVAKGAYEGGTFEELPNDGGETGYFVFQVFSANVPGGDPDVLGFIGVSRKTGRIVIINGEYCHSYPYHAGDKALKPGKGADIPLSCEDEDAD